MKHLAPIAGLFALSAFTAAAEPVDYVILNASSIPASLTGAPGDASAGADVFEAAGCADCHAAPGVTNAPNIGPDLTDAGARLTPGEIRLMIVAPSVVVPETEMPAYYAIGVFGEAPEALVGRTRLSATEIEALVAWLSSPTE